MISQPNLKVINKVNKKVNQKLKGLTQLPTPLSLIDFLRFHPRITSSVSTNRTSIQWEQVWEHSKPIAWCLQWATRHHSISSNSNHSWTLCQVHHSSARYHLCITPRCLQLVNHHSMASQMSMSTFQILTRTFKCNTCSRKWMVLHKDQMASIALSKNVNNKWDKSRTMTCSVSS